MDSMKYEIAGLAVMTAAAFLYGPEVGSFVFSLSILIEGIVCLIKFRRNRWLALMLLVMVVLGSVFTVRDFVGLLSE